MTWSAYQDLPIVEADAICAALGDLIRESNAQSEVTLSPRDLRR
jgi:hypothetical protein